VPANVGESTKGQKRSQAEIKRALDKSIRTEMPKGRLMKDGTRRFQHPDTGRFTLKRSKRTLAEQKARTSWAGADKKISKVRPKSPVEPLTPSATKTSEQKLATRPVGSRSPVVICKGLVTHARVATTESCRIVESTARGKSARAKQSHKPATAAKQRWAEANEGKLAKGLSGRTLDDNEAVDVIIKAGGKEHGIELKTLLDNTNNKITMHPDSVLRKEVWRAASRNRTLHTVVLDDRNKFLAGKFKSQFTGSRIYYRRGVGAFRVNSMVPVRNYSELRRLMLASDSELEKMVRVIAG